jgi:hypothetical protein
MYRELADGVELPEAMPPRERRELDGQFGGWGMPLRLVEVDEQQHFNEFRATTLGLYPTDLALGFPRNVWLAQSNQRVARAGGGLG